jgi:hypothetical protein
MKFARYVPILLAVCSLAVASRTLDRGPVDVLALTPGDELRIAFQSDGCFHHVRYTLSIRPDSFGAAVQLKESEANLAPGWKLALTRTRLDRHDLEQLDNLFTFYRGRKGGGCTTVDRIEITSVERGVVRRESHVDSSCASYDNDALLPIGRLVTMVRDGTQ